MLCQCGCGLEASKGRSFRRFHRANLLPQLCVCGCGEFAKTGNKYIRGHTSFNLTDEQEQKRREAISKATKGKPCSIHRKLKLVKYYENPRNRARRSEEQIKAHREHPEWFDNYAAAAKLRRKGIIPSGFKGRNHTEEAKCRMQENSRNNWQNPDYVRKVRARRTPSGLELKFIELNEEKSWGLKYVGDFRLNIGKRFPDFWNGDKKVIEIFGYYHQDSNEEFELTMYYKEHGYDCLVLWARELNKPIIHKTIGKVESFLKEEKMKRNKIEEAR